ncbi:MAG: DUF3311 domain-containing protein [Sciscionella sp.]
MDDETSRTPGRTLRLLLALIPFVGLCAAIPLVNRVTPYVLGLPFFVFWIALWSVLTSACMAGVYLLDPRNRK